MADGLPGSPASDCCSLERPVDELRLPGRCHDADHYFATLKGLAGPRAKGKRICYSHEPEFWTGVPQRIPLN